MEDFLDRIGSGDDKQLFLIAQKESEALKERMFELYILYRLSKNLNLSMQLDDFFDNSFSFLKDSLNIGDFCLMLLDEETKELRMWKADGACCEDIKDVTFRIGEGISGIVAQTGESMLIQNVHADERFLHYKGARTDIGSFMSIPLKISNGRIIGVLNVHKKEKNAFRDSDVSLFRAIAENISHTIERLKHYEEMQHNAMFDELTGLYNRRYFFENMRREWNKVKRYGGVFSIIMMDIDRFKYFNDTYGHLLGDEALRRVSAILKSYVRQGDVVARYGGEEFIIYIPGDKDSAFIVADKLRSLVEKHAVIEVPGGEIEGITITGGIASYPDDGETLEEVIANADKYLFEGKQKGRNRVLCMPSSGIDDGSDDRRVTERFKVALRIARVVEQPQYIEMKVNNDEWRLCNLKDMSKTGIRGETEFKANIGDVFMFRLVNGSETMSPNVFYARIANIKQSRSRYQWGAEIIDGHMIWQRFFSLMSH
jgi:diguanylate cyclase (GGDEF)-like protein